VNSHTFASTRPSDRRVTDRGLTLKTRFPRSWLLWCCSTWIFSIPELGGTVCLGRESTAEQ
jgi:hypothetical protein